MFIFVSVKGREMLNIVVNQSSGLRRSLPLLVLKGVFFNVFFKLTLTTYFWRERICVKGSSSTGSRILVWYDTTNEQIESDVLPRLTHAGYTRPIQYQFNIFINDLISNALFFKTFLWKKRRIYSHRLKISSDRPVQYLNERRLTKSRYWKQIKACVPDLVKLSWHRLTVESTCFI